MPHLAILAQKFGLSSDVIAAIEGKVFLDEVFLRVSCKTLYKYSCLKQKKNKKSANTLSVTSSLSLKGVL